MIWDNPSKGRIILGKKSKILKEEVFPAKKRLNTKVK
jgi:hypothetical protein